jgi:plasmid stabilization system protein ParE
MALPIRWSPRSVQHLENICEYISRDSKEYASIFADRIVSVVRSIPLFPQSGRIVPEYNNPDLREKIYENYRIVYRLNKGFVEIVAICHGARLLSNVICD